MTYYQSFQWIQQLLKGVVLDRIVESAEGGKFEATLRFVANHTEIRSS